MPILIDSTVFIDALRGNAAAERYLLEVRRAETALSVTPVRTEVLAGAPVEALRATYILLDTVGWLDITVERADVAAGLLRRYRPASSRIDIVDALVAATAIELDASVATSNVRDYPMFPGLEPPY